MPKKIRKINETELKGNKEKLINENNIHYLFIVLFIFLVGICAFVGVYKYQKDKYHVHKDVALVKFIYSEKVENGYNVYEVKEMNNKDIYATYSTPTINKDKKWSENKYLDFNEEIYATNILQVESAKKENDLEAEWSLEITLKDKTVKYYSSTTSNIPKEELARIILEYFNQEILYK